MFLGHNSRILWLQDELRRTKTLLGVASQGGVDEDLGQQVNTNCIVSE